MLNEILLSISLFSSNPENKLPLRESNETHPDFIYCESNSCFVRRKIRGDYLDRESKAQKIRGYENNFWWRKN